MTPRLVRGFLTSDGTLNFSSAVFSKPKELDYIIQKPVFSAMARSPIIKGIDIMLTKGVRRIPIVDSKNLLMGIVTATDIVNFLGGGDYFNIAKVKYSGRFFSALYEPLESIMSKDVVDIDLEAKFSTALERMINENVGAIPVVSNLGDWKV